MTRVVVFTVKLIKIAGVIFGLFIALMLGMYIYLGGFSSVVVERGEFGPAEIVYSTHLGPYKGIGESWTKFQKQWEAAGITECDSLALYLDPPGTPETNLRSILACRIDALPAAQKAAAKSKLRHFVIPKSKAVVSSFPYKSGASFVLGPMKVYPAFHKVLDQEKLMPPLGIETYGVMKKIKAIGFVMPIEGDRATYKQLFESF